MMKKNNGTELNSGNNLKTEELNNILEKYNEGNNGIGNGEIEIKDSEGNHIVIGENVINDFLKRELSGDSESIESMSEIDDIAKIGKTLSQGSSLLVGKNEKLFLKKHLIGLENFSLAEKLKMFEKQSKITKEKAEKGIVLERSKGFSEIKKVFEKSTSENSIVKSPSGSFLDELSPREFNVTRVKVEEQPLEKAPSNGNLSESSQTLIDKIDQALKGMGSNSDELKFRLFSLYKEKDIVVSSIKKKYEDLKSKKKRES